MALRGSASARRLGYGLIFGVVTALLTNGCGSSSSTGTTTGPTLTARTLRGVVLNGSTGVAVVAANLSIGGAQGLSGADGSFQIANVQRVDQVLAVAANGYQASSQTVLSTQDSLTVKLVPTDAGNVSPPPGPPGR